MEPKKISFGFMKTKKQDKPIVTEQREYIESVEENSIKIFGKELTVVAEPLIIPMKPNTLMTAERLKEIALKVESSLNEPDNIENDQQEETKQSENETLEQMATRELLKEAKKEVKMETESLKILVPSIPVIDGQKESSLEDYESVPIQDFGMAMLRGMGWTPGKEMSKYKIPNLRPKGLGLGADKVVTDNQKKNQSKDNDKELEIVQNAFVKITNGKYAGCYGKVISLDEDNGRVLVNIPIKKDTVSLSEFMMHPVAKSEFEKQSKVINADSYEAYKNNEAAQKSNDRNSKKDNGSSSSHKSRYADKSDRNESRNVDNSDRSESRYISKSERTESRYADKSVRNETRYKDRSDREDKRNKSDRCDHSQRRDNEKHSNGRNRDRDFSSDEEVYQRKAREKKRYSTDSFSSDADVGKSKANRGRSSDSEKEYRERDRSSSRKKKKDIDKKRKGKKKKRDRDRSPGYKKHRK